MDHRWFELVYAFQQLTSVHQTMLQKIIWNHDECLMNLQHLTLSTR